MPILSAEPSVYPETLLDEFMVESGEPGESGEPVEFGEPVEPVEPVESCDCRWWALYTKARQEKAVARRLLGFKIPFYLPLVKKRSVCRGRRIRSYIPLFSGYLFLFGTDEQRVQSLTTNRISRILPVADQARLRKELARLRQLIETGAPLTVESRLTPGNFVRVRHGPFVGLEGTVLKRHGRTRLLVSVNFLQQGASVEIDDVCLEPLD